MSDSKNKNEKSDSVTNHQMGMVLLLVICAVVSQREHQIREWFYEHMLGISAVAIAFIAGLGAWFWSRIKKREEVYFERQRNLRQVQTTQHNHDYYRRRDKR